PAPAETPMIVLLLSLLFAAGPAAERTAERAGVVGRARAEPATVPLVGDVRLTLEVEAAAPLAVEPPDLTRFPGWHVRQTTEPETSPLPGGRQRWRQTVRLSPDRPGELPLPVPAVRVRAGGRETPVELTWEPLTVAVATALPRADIDEARGVTEPEPAPAPPDTPLRDWLAAGGTVLGLVAVLVLVWRRRRKPRPVPEPPADVWAAAELDRLAGRDPA